MYIETERLIIRTYEEKDKEDLAEYMLQRVHAKFEDYPDFTVEKAQEEIDYRSKSDEFYAIELKCEQKVIGNIYLGKRQFQSLEIGYVLNENYMNEGYGSEAAKMAIQWAFYKGIHRIYAECSPNNTASWKTMEKIGMKREGLLRQNVSFHHDENGNPIYWDTCVYGILPTDI